MFVTYPSNIDYLIQDVRLHIGDVDATNPRFSDSLIRTALLGGIKMLQRRWGKRYLVYNPAMRVAHPDVTVPSGMIYVSISDGNGFIPDDTSENDVFRNPYITFLSDMTTVISQEDELPIVLAASIILRKSQLTSSAEAFQSWSDGEFSFSNVSKARALGDLYTQDILDLDKYFQKRLASPLRGSFAWNLI